MPSKEIEILAKLDEIIGQISDADIQRRILWWVNDKYGGKGIVGNANTEVSNHNHSVIANDQGSNPRGSSPEEKVLETPKEREIPGIALLDENEKIKFTIRDIKASSATDAGIRLTLVALYVHEFFFKEANCSRKKVLNPLLKNWRVYDGNIRKAISNHRGIVGEKKSDLISLDFHAKKEAEKVIEEIKDENKKGSWTPGMVGKGTKRRKAGTKDTDAV